MASFAELNENNVVLRVVAINDNDCLNQDNKESETIGALFCHNLYGGRWVQTSYNKRIRKNYAGIGYTYDQERDAFIAPKPFGKWILNEEICEWKAPIPYPTDNKFYVWNDNQGEWEEVIGN